MVSYLSFNKNSKYSDNTFKTIGVVLNVGFKAITGPIDTTRNTKIKIG